MRRFVCIAGVVWAAAVWQAASAAGAMPVAGEMARAAVQSEKVALVQQPLPAGDVRDIGGYVGQRIVANREGSLKRFDIERHTRMVEEKKQRDWWWIGEQPGKWLESAVLVSRETGDAQLERQARKILARLIAAQEPGGYVGITDPAVRTDAQPLRGMDPYELYFMLHGLITAAQECNDPAALAAARKLGDYFVERIGPGKAEFWPSQYRPPENVNTILCPQYTWVPEGTPKAPTLSIHSAIAGHTAHYGWEGTLLIDPMMRLYHATGDTSYLAWGKWVTENIDRWSGWNAFSRLDDVAAGKLGMHQLQPYVHSHTFQMNFLGFLRLYQATGDATLLKKVRGAWDDVAGRQLYITGGVSVGEHYEPGYRRPITGHVVETCANMSWMELTQYLLELTGEPRYADAIERLLFNHVFASQTIDGDCYRYHTPPNGFKPDDYFHGPDCCSSSGHRIVSMLPRFFYAVGKGGVYVNQYVASTAQVQTPDGTAVTLQVETAYPQEEKVIIRVTPAKEGNFPLNLRIPAWCQKPAVAVNGQDAGAMKAGTYARLERRWAPGDMVTITLPMKTEWIEHDHWEGGEAPWALVRGPLVYAIDTVWWDDARAAMPAEVGREAGVVRGAAIKPVAPAAGALGPFLESDVKLATGQTVKATWVPFSNIGRWYRDGAAKPAHGSKAYSYAVWLPDSAGASFSRQAAEKQRDAAMIKESVDFVRIGNEASEQAHKVAGTGNTGGFRERTYRHAGKGGWFSYELKVPADAPADLVVTYWGGEIDRREFDVLVNDQKVATQVLKMDKPEEFFEVRYPIPAYLLKDKTDALGQKVDRVTVKFQGRDGSTAGGVFGLRTVVREGGQKR